MHIIPAIDIIEGKCVRLTQGDYNQKKIYNERPLEVAKSFESAGITRLHVVDLDGAKAKKVVNYRVLERLASKTSLQIDFGGGLKSDEDVRIVFESGAHQVTIGTIAVKDPDLFWAWFEKYGAEKIILGADFKDQYIRVSGWTEQSQLELFPFLEDYTNKGIRYTICTDISKDGLLQGSAVNTYKLIKDSFPKLQLIASGGVSAISELDTLKEIQCYGAIIGKAIYEGRITLSALSKYILNG